MKSVFSLDLLVLFMVSWFPVTAFADNPAGGAGEKTKIVIGGKAEAFKGTIDREVIRRVILFHIKAIRVCYEEGLVKKSGLYGKLVIGWDIGEQGKVVSSRVKSDEINHGVADCILGQLKTWQFPDPPPGQVVEVEAYPFVFADGSPK